MSGVGERDDAPEVEEIEPGEIEEVDAPEDEGQEGDAVEEDDGEAGQGGDDEKVGGQAALADPQPKPRSAATIAVQEAKRAAKAAKEEAEAARREAAELRAQVQGRQTQEQQRLEQERLSLMPPEEKYEYLLKKQESNFEARFGALQFQQADSGDRVAFESLCARQSDQGKALASVRDEVESRLAELRRNGGNTSREVLAKYILGERAYERAGRVKSKQAANGAKNIARNKVNAPASRGDVQSGQRRSGDEVSQRRSRLEDQQI